LQSKQEPDTPDLIMPLSAISANRKRQEAPQQDPQSFEGEFDAYERWLGEEITATKAKIARNRGVIVELDQTDDTAEKLSDVVMIPEYKLQNGAFKNVPQQFKVGGMRRALKDNLLELC
jgi:hypothetical protein